MVYSPPIAIAFTATSRWVSIVWVMRQKRMKTEWVSNKN